VYHPLDPKIVTIIDRWSLLRGHLCSKRPIWYLKMVVVLDWWPLLEVVVSSGLTVQWNSVRGHSSNTWLSRDVDKVSNDLFFFKRNLRWHFLTFLTTRNLRFNFGLEQRPPVNNDLYHFAYKYVSQIRKTVISKSKSPSERRSISPKRKWQLCWFFMLLRSACVKVCKILMKLTRGGGRGSEKCTKIVTYSLNSFHTTHLSVPQ